MENMLENVFLGMSIFVMVMPFLLMPLILIMIIKGIK